MDFVDALKRRHSVRNYGPRPVEQDKLDRVLEAANLAPSAGNLQSYEIYLVTGVKKRSVLAQAAFGQGFVLAAPVSLVFCAHPARAAEEYGDRGRQLYAVQDATIACCFAMLAASAEGLSTCWVGSFDEDAVRNTIGAPEDLRPVSILPIGYAAGEPELRGRRPIEDLVHAVS